jgi:hypothetical protein
LKLSLLCLSAFAAANTPPPAPLGTRPPADTARDWAEVEGCRPYPRAVCCCLAETVLDPPFVMGPVLGLGNPDPGPPILLSPFPYDLLDGGGDTRPFSLR